MLLSAFRWHARHRAILVRRARALEGDGLLPREFSIRCCTNSKRIRTTSSCRPGQTIADAFEAVNIHLRAHGEADPPEINTFAIRGMCCPCLHQGSTIWVAGVGDCQAYLTRSTRTRSYPSCLCSTAWISPGEKARLEGLGAYIRPAMVDPDGEMISTRCTVTRLYPEYGPGLAISRSFGDLDASDLGIIATPEITCSQYCVRRTSISYSPPMVFGSSGDPMRFWALSTTASRRE